MALFIILRNHRTRKVVHKSESPDLLVRKNKVWYWVVSGIVFISLCVYAFDGWYNWRYDFYEGRALQCVDGKWGYINRLHSVIVPHMFDLAWNFNDGLACVGIGEKYDRKYGYIDCNGNIVIPLIYDRPAEFINGIAYVEKDGRHGTINTEGEEMSKTWRLAWLCQE